MVPDDAPRIAALIVSYRSHNRKSLASVFSTLPVDDYWVSRIRDAVEMLDRRSFCVIFCEKRLPDDSYNELPAEARARYPDVLFCIGEWDAYLNALRLGATEVLRCPLHSTDVGPAIIRAI